MKNTLVLARKYRPNKLSEIVGQDVLVDTIRNSIFLNRIHHAFLFTGTRGVGKTTTARIIALTLNCQNINLTQITKHEDIDPCLHCDSCQSILSNSNPDVIEFDAASNTSVEAAREIIEQCKYQPVSSKYKIYIIDEVHMMSKSAFNALLKTLEEPPERVKFIFATTEVKKVPITILSRCQKFYLKNIAQEVIQNLLSSVAEKENVSIAKDAANLIALYADGSMRDGLSLLDQAISNSISKTVSLDDVKVMLAIPDNILILELFYNIYLGKTENALNNLNSILSGQTDIQSIVSTLLSITTDGMIFTEFENTGRYNVNVDYTTTFTKLKQMDLLNIPRLIRIYQIIVKSLEESKHLSNKNYLTALIYRVSYASTLPTPVEILKIMENDILKKAISTIGNTQIIK